MCALVCVTSTWAAVGFVLCALVLFLTRFEILDQETRDAFSCLKYKFLMESMVYFQMYPDYVYAAKKS